MSRFFLIALISFLLFSNNFAFGQNFILSESSSDSNYNYWNQINLIAKSLESNILSSDIEFRDEEIGLDKFNVLSEKYNQNLPDSFYTEYKDVPVISTNRISDSRIFIKWTYANMDFENNVKVYMQLVVYLFVDDKEGGALFPKVESFEVLAKDEILEINYNKLKISFAKRKQENENNPLPIPPPPGF
jgi:hypothetical protein